MKTIASAFAGLSLIVGSALAAQAPAASTPAAADNKTKTTTPR